MIIFNGLAEGSYHYLIKAKDTSGNEYTLVSSDFNIGNLENSNTEPLTSSLITTTTTATNTTSTIIEKDLELSETEVYIKVGEKNIINANQGNLTYTSSDESIAIVVSVKYPLVYHSPKICCIIESKQVHRSDEND